MNLILTAFLQLLIARKNERSCKQSTEIILFLKKLKTKETLISLPLNEKIVECDWS